MSQYVFPFENRGVEVGVTLHHPHGQIYAYPFVPPIPARELSQQRAHFDAHGRGPAAAIIADEIADARRVLYKGPGAIAFMPVCARYSVRGVGRAQRTRIPRSPRSTPSARADLARALKTVLLKFDGCGSGRFLTSWSSTRRRPTARRTRRRTCTSSSIPPYRMPGRLKYLAGSELGAGMFTADTLPEEKAAELRAVEVAAELA